MHFSTYRIFCKFDLKIFQIYGKNILIMIYLFTGGNKRLCGTANSLEDKLERVHTFYTAEQEKEFGILAIKIQLL